MPLAALVAHNLNVERESTSGRPVKVPMYNWPSTRDTYTGQGRITFTLDLAGSGEVEATTTAKVDGGAFELAMSAPAVAACSVLEPALNLTIAKPAIGSTGRIALATVAVSAARFALSAHRRLDVGLSDRIAIEEEELILLLDTFSLKEHQ